MIVEELCTAQGSVLPTCGCPVREPKGKVAYLELASTHIIGITVV